MVEIWLIRHVTGYRSAYTHCVEFQRSSVINIFFSEVDIATELPQNFEVSPMI
jgi:hypothetical protein